MKKLTAFCSLILFLACGSPAVEKPDNLIEEEVMVNIFYDLAVMDAIKSHSPLSLSSRAIVPDIYIYKKYKIDSLQFAKSNQYYAADIEKYKKIYVKVGERLEANKAQADSLVIKSNKTPGLKLPTPVEDKDRSGGFVR
ncbi:MAG TPA: DUF4296 domain-containing protein [Flavobacterium sp.]|jgi:hypothetical protein|nr:DUF4296 domain-containing protein [Flavobacterium sp.]